MSDFLAYIFLPVMGQLWTLIRQWSSLYTSWKCGNLLKPDFETCFSLIVQVHYLSMVWKHEVSRLALSQKPTTKYSILLKSNDILTHPAVQGPCCSIIQCACPYEDHHAVPDACTGTSELFPLCLNFHNTLLPDNTVNVAFTCTSYTFACTPLWYLQTGFP